MARVSLTIAIALLLALSLAAAQKSELVLVEAGFGPFNQRNEIRVIRRVHAGYPTYICPGFYFYQGFSIQCRGTDVNGNVEFLMNGMRVQTESRAPFHIAGDRDENGLVEIFPFTDYLSVKRCAAGKKCRITIKCAYNRNNGKRASITRTLLILPSGCDNTT